MTTDTLQFRFGLDGGGAVRPARRRRLDQPGLPLTFPLRDKRTFQFQILTEPEGKAMSRDTEGLLIGQRWADALRRRFVGAHQAKRIARALDCEVRTAESWLSGQAPYAKYLFRAARRFGAALVLEVLAPDDRLAEAARLETALDDVEARLRALGSDLVELRIREDKP